MKRTIFALVASIIVGAAFSANTCPTPKVATTIPRVATECQSGLFGFKWCYDESWDNGGCAAPNNQANECNEGPMTNPISWNDYKPQTSGGHCTCVLETINTPAGQMKGIALSTPCSRPGPVDPEDPADPGSSGGPESNCPAN